jgi:hypothetical protein
MRQTGIDHMSGTITQKPLQTKTNHNFLIDLRTIHFQSIQIVALSKIDLLLDYQLFRLLCIKRFLQCLYFLDT